MSGSGRRPEKTIDKRYNRYGVVNLTDLDTVDAAYQQQEDFELCPMCEISLTKAGDNLFCKGCGLVRDINSVVSNATVAKKSDTIIPRITSRKASSNNIFFKSIKSTQINPDRRRKRPIDQFLEDDDERTIQTLKNQGALIGDSVTVTR
jgi:hypothetical protein